MIHQVSRVGKHLKACQGWSHRKSDCVSHPIRERRGTIVSVHRTISTTVLQRSVTTHAARTTLAEPVGSEDVSGAAASTPDAAAANREGCAATCDFSGRDAHAGTGTMATMRCAFGHVPEVTKPGGRGSGHLKSGWSRDRGKV